MNGHHHDEVFSDGEGNRQREERSRPDEDIPEHSSRPEEPEESQGPVLRTGRQIPGIKMLPGLNDLNKGMVGLSFRIMAHNVGILHF